LSDSLLNSTRRTIIGLAAQHRLAAIYEEREFVADGGLRRTFPKCNAKRLPSLIRY
jgi:hypothetical protein